VYPSIYKWTAYPVTCWLEAIWKQEKGNILKRKAVSPYVVEFTSMLERSLNFSQTGNAKVLTKSIMDQVGLSLGLVRDGMPVLRSGLVIFDKTLEAVVVRDAEWPVNARKQQPMVASVKSHTINYSLEQYNVSPSGRGTLTLAWQH
jgi:hypothetical protein